MKLADMVRQIDFAEDLERRLKREFPDVTWAIDMADDDVVRVSALFTVPGPEQI